MFSIPDRTAPDFWLEDWLVQPAQCRMSKNARTVQVRPKVMDLLTHLASHSGEVVSKDQLLDRVWGAEAVGESALTRTVTELRRALGDDAGHPRLLETIPKRGYRLIGSVRNWSSAPVRIAVLPFDQIDDEPARRYLADGLAEDTIVSLGTSDPAQLVVVGRSSTLQYRSTTKPATQIGHELAVDYLVEGVIRTEGKRLRLTSKLVRVRDDVAIWSQSYERDLTSVLGLQLEISTAIAEQIRGRIASVGRADDTVDTFTGVLVGKF